MTQIFLRTLRHIPLPSTMNDALSVYDAVSLDKNSSYHSTCLLPVSYSFYTALSPWILQNAFLDKLEFDLVINCPTFQYATELGLSPDFDDDLCIHALKLTQRFVKKVSIIRDVTNQQIQDLIIHTPSLQQLYVEPVERAQAASSLHFILRGMKEHPTVTGRVAFCGAYALFLKNNHVSTVLDELVKEDAVTVIRDLILNHGTKDLGLLERLIEAFAAATMIDRVVKARERMLPGFPLPPPKGVDFFAEIFELLADFFRNGDIKYISARPSLMREIGEFLQNFVVSADFVARYMENLIIPFLKEIEEKVLLNRDELFIFENKSEFDEYNHQYDTSVVNVHKAKNLKLADIRAILVTGRHMLDFYAAFFGDEFWCGKRSYHSWGHNNNSSSLSTNFMTTNTREDSSAPSSEADASFVGENFYKNIKDDEIRRLESGRVSSLIFPKATSSMFTSSSSASESLQEDAAEPNKNIYKNVFIDDFSGEPPLPLQAVDFRRFTRVNVPSFRKAFFKMIDSGRKSYAHIPFDKIVEFYDFVENPALEITPSERVYMRKGVSDFFQRIYIHYIKRHTVGEERQLMPMLMSLATFKKSKPVIPRENNDPEQDYLYDRSLMDYEVKKVGRPALLADNVMRSFINLLFKKRTPENDTLAREKAKDQRKAFSSSSKDKKSEEDKEEKDETEEEEDDADEKEEIPPEGLYTIHSNDNAIHTFLYFLTSTLAGNPIFARNFAMTASSNGLIDFLVQDMNAVEEECEYKKLWSEVANRELKIYALVLKKVELCLMAHGDDDSGETKSSKTHGGDNVAVLTAMGFMQDNEEQKKWFKVIFIDKKFDQGERGFGPSSSDDSDDGWETDDED